MNKYKEYIEAQNIPDLGKWPLHYIFEDMKLQHNTDQLWLEFGVYKGSTINYISKFTEHTVHGFDSFEGLPEWWKPGCPLGLFDLKGQTPEVNSNVTLIPGWFNTVVEIYLDQYYKHNLAQFIHIDCDLYSSTKTVLDIVKHRLVSGCVIIFDELINYPGYDSDNGELRAWYEFVTENDVEYDWIGMGVPPNDPFYKVPEAVAVRIHSIKEKI